MTLSENVQETLFQELVFLLEPLKTASESARNTLDFLSFIGWDLEGFSNSNALVTKLGGLASDIETLRAELNAPPESISDLISLLASTNSIFATIRTLDQGLDPSGELPDISSLPGHILDGLFALYLFRKKKDLTSVLMALGVMRESSREVLIKNGKVVRGASMLPSIDFGQIGRLLSDPTSTLSALYLVNNMSDQASLNEIADRMFPRIEAILGMNGVDTLIGSETSTGVLDAQEEEMLKSFFTFTTKLRTNAGALVELGATIGLIHEDGKPGVLVVPFGDVELEHSIGDWVVKILIEASGDGFFVSSDGFELLSGENSERVVLSVISRRGDENEPALLIGSTKESRLEIGQFGITGWITLDRNNQDYGIELDVAKGALVVNAGDADGFLQKILPPEGINTNFDFGVGWSSTDGFYFRGSAALEVTIPVHKTLGSITIDSIYLVIKPRNDGSIGIAFAASFDGKLGPVSVTVQRIGLKTALSFPDDGGNLGPVNLDPPAFLPPTGAGLLVDAGGIVGGGYLEFDNDNKRYVGILALNFGEISLVAIGLITTRMPDGSDGFSLLINIGVEFSPPIQLSFGFTLSGVGGLIGINRTIMVEVLRSGLQNHTLDSILFPDPTTVIVNAPKIISDLRSVFPPEEGRFIVAPIINCGFGSPNFILAEIGVFIELPEPVRIVILGQIAATFPKPEKIVIELHLDVIGAIEFQKKKLFISATLQPPSRIRQYPLTGTGGFFWRWGRNALIAMSLGGFHPKFAQIPTELQGQKRLALALSSSSKFQLTCQVYQALTSNTLQFGARVELYAKVSKASVDGFLGFDTLIYFLPFGFEVSIAGNVAARAFGRKLASISIHIELSGPTPWNARGKAKFKILWKKIKVSFNKTWGPSDAPTLPAIDPWLPLRDALNRPESWGSTLPNTRTMVEALRSPEEDDAATTTDVILVHPAGTIEVRPNVLPFGIQLEKFGKAPVTGHHTFDIESMMVEGDQPADDFPLDFEYVDDYFARGEYQNLSSSQRLSLPSYEAMPGVVVVRSDAIDYGGVALEYELEYEPIHIDENNASQGPIPGKHGKLNWATAARLITGNAARNGLLRTTGYRKFEVLSVSPRVTMNEEGYTIVRKSDLEDIDLGANMPTNNGTMTRWAADQALNAYEAQHPESQGKLQVVAAYETEHPESRGQPEVVTDYEAAA